MLTNCSFRGCLFHVNLMLNAEREDMPVSWKRTGSTEICNSTF